MTKATQITSVAELKRRLAVGTRVTLVDHSVTQGDSVTYPRHKYMGVVREVTAAQSKSFALTPVGQDGHLVVEGTMIIDGRFVSVGSSWQDWPKKAELITRADDPDVFEIDKGWVSCTYRIES